MMKKLILLFSVLLFISCEKEAEQTTATLMVNVSFKYENSAETQTAAPALVMLFKGNAAEFDFDESVNSMFKSQSMTLKNGTKAVPAYTSSSFSGVNIFEDIEKGNYTIIAYYKPDGYSWPFLYYYAYKEVSINDMQMHNIIFTWTTEAGRFVRK